MPHPAPLDAARALVAERFPPARQAWSAGSVVPGGATSTSDLDVTVLLEDGTPYRESLTYGGRSVEGDGGARLRADCAGVVAAGPRLRHALAAALAGDRLPLTRVADEVLDVVGGRLWSGFRLDAPVGVGRESS